MDRNRRNKRYSNWNNQKNQDSQNRKNQNFNNNNNKEKSYQFNHTIYQNDAAERERQKAISEIKTREVKCGICGGLISDIASAITDKSTGKTVHFDCILDKIAKEEKPLENEKVAYIGQGRFAVLSYENIREQKNFKIKKIIEVEDRENKSEWRTEISDLYSKIN